MKRKIVAILVVLLLLCQLPLGALAVQEGTTAVRSAYWTEDVLYTFVNLPQEYPEELEVSLFVNNYEQGHPNNPQLLQSTGATVHCMLLVDNSSSMNKYTAQLSSFAKELMQSSDNLDVSIASVSGEFHVLATGLKEWSDVRSNLRNLSYQYDGSDICGGTAKALAYLGSESYRAGDVVCLVVITDGEPWYSNDADTESTLEKQAIGAAAAAMNAYPEIVVNTLCFEEWEEDTFSALSAGRGLHLDAKTASDAGEAGKTFAESCSSMYTVTFPLPGFSGGETSMQLFLDNSWYSIGTVRNINLAPALGEGDVIVIPPIGDTMPVLNTDPTEETVDPTDETADPTEETGATLPVDSAVPPAETVAETTEETVEMVTVPVDGGDEQGISPMVIAAAIALVVVVLLIVVLLVLGAKKKKANAFAIRVQVEVLAGEIARKKAVYHLNRELLIGTASQCDIVIRDPFAAPVNTRIFMQGQLIYIEDMNSPRGTVLNGMRIFSSNRLRSEDEITIGNTVLRVLF